MTHIISRFSGKLGSSVGVMILFLKERPWREKKRISNVKEK
jgi:hypothetical protein